MDRTINALTNTLDELSMKPKLMQLLWRNDISDRIKEAYKDLSEALGLCKVRFPFRVCTLRGELVCLHFLVCADVCVYRHVPGHERVRAGAADGLRVRHAQAG